MEFHIEGVRKWKLDVPTSSGNVKIDADAHISHLMLTDTLQKTVEALLRRSLKASRDASDVLIQRRATVTATIRNDKEAPDPSTSSQKHDEGRSSMPTKDQHKPSGPISDQHDERESMKSLKERLLSSAMKSEQNETIFIATADINKIIDLGFVSDALRGHHNTSTVSELASTVIEGSYRKIFVILVLIDKVASIERFTRSGTRDEDLPLSLQAKEPITLVTRSNDKVPPSCFRDWEVQEIERFISTQWQVVAPLVPEIDPVLTGSFASSSILPFIENPDLTDTISNDSFSQVYRVRIGPSASASHWSFQNSKSDKKPRTFAIKRFTSSQNAEYGRETSTLEKIQQAPGQSGIIKYFGSFSYENAQHVILEYAAGGNLRDFWRDPKYQYLRGEQGLQWLLEQLHGLASGLELLHEYGTHGDIKPENILVSLEPSGDKPVLKISDFETSQRVLVRDIEDKTRLSVAYKAPEIDHVDGTLSEKYDIWSAGCVFLEFLLWNTQGYQAIDEFCDARKSLDHSLGIEGDAFFSITKKGYSRAVVRLKPAVEKEISSLQNYTKDSPKLQALLEIIEKLMLQPNPRNRASSAVIADRLKKIQESESLSVLKSVTTPLAAPKSSEGEGRRVLRTIDHAILRLPNDPVTSRRHDENLRLLLADKSKAVSIFDQGRILLEDIARIGPFDWSPLGPVSRETPNSESVLLWEYDGVTLSIPLNKSETNRCKGRIRTITQKDEQLPRYNNSSGARPSKTTSAAWSLSSIIQLLMTFLKGNKRDEDERKNHQKARTGAPSMPTREKHEVYFCIQRPWTDTRKAFFTTPIVAEDLADDAALFGRIKDLLEGKSRKFRPRFSFWTSTSSVNFSKFDEHDFVSIFTSTTPLSDDKFKGYKIPTDAADKEGLDLDIYLRKIGETILTGISEPSGRLGRGKRKVLNSLPKRRLPPTLGRTAETSGWCYYIAIQFRLKPFKIMVYLALSLGLAFVPFSMVFNDKWDLQTAFSPANTMITVLALWIGIKALERER